MATATLTTDLVVIGDAEATSGWAGRENNNMVNLSQDIFIQGNSGVGGEMAKLGVNGLAYTMGASVDMRRTHIRAWMWSPLNFDTLANGGLRLRVEVAGGGNWGEWYCGGSDVNDPAGQWVLINVNTSRAFDRSSATLPDLSQIRIVGVLVNTLDITNQLIPSNAVDVMRYGKSITITGGTTGDRISFANLAAADNTPAYGVFRKQGREGVFLAIGEINTGNTAGVLSSWIQDTNKVIAFPSLPVAGSHYVLRHQGNSTGTNHFQMGISSGSGVDKEGAAGGIIASVGAAPFRIEAIDTNMDTTAYFGVTMLGPGAALDDQIRNCKVDDGGTFTDKTTDINNSGANDVSAFPTPAVNDAIYFGADERFYNLKINTGTAKAGTYTIVWEYYNGSSWASLTNLTDGTNGFTTTGLQTVDYAIPDNWAKTTVDSNSHYWVRARISAFTSSTTVPLLTIATQALTGDIRLEDAVVEMISCALTGMGSIRVRNGAFLKKTVISASNAPAKHAALDLGGADPTADTVRDLTIQNCSKGILLKGSGNVTYNFRNIKFSGNTKDVRVDFGASDTVTINVLEGGTSPTIDNVNGSTVNVVANPVSLSIHAQDIDTAAAIVGARVWVPVTSTASGRPFNQTINSIVRSGSTATVTFAAVHNLATNDYLNILGCDQPEYNHTFQVTVTGSTTLEVTVSGTPASGSGTMVGTWIIISGVTNGSGDISASYTYAASQPINGRIRTASGAGPYYKTAPITGTVSNTTGLSVTVPMVPDE